MAGEATVFIVDDDAAVREGLQMLFESAGYTVAAFADAEAFLRAYDPQTPCCLILDLRMPATSGLELQELLGREDAPPPIIFLTGHGSVPTAVKALKGGAVDFFQKPIADEQQLLDRVAEALRRDLDTRAAAARRAGARRLFEQLTPREVEVMEQICDGKANKVVAIELGISERTVELHRSHVMQKLGLRSVAELIRFRDDLGKP
ncbi:MAG: response regulator [Gammaproteobacteria bacterium]|jgi:two-component system response regulator FixJ